MIVKCETCSLFFEDCYRSTICPHEAFPANDGCNNFTVHDDAHLGAGPPVPSQLKRDCCPICGHQFDYVQDVNFCPTPHWGEQNFRRDELITEDDDYVWCQ